jgi:hypothetical protein
MADIEPDDPRYIPEDLMERLTEERTIVTNETEEQQTRRIFLERGPVAAATIAHIAQYGTTERVRFDASKYIVDRVIGVVGSDNGVSDPLKSFLDDLVVQAEQHANAGASE